MKRTFGIAAVVLGAVIVGGGVLSANAQDGPLAGNSSATGFRAMLSDGAESVAEFLGMDDTVAPGALDDGKELLPQATVSLEDAISAAQAAVPGNLGEVDLEYYNGVLVFNVDVGNADVKIDAANGDYLGQESDD